MKNKKNDLFFLIFNTITNIVYYSGAVLGIFLGVLLIVISVFPEYFQGKIFLPMDLNIHDLNEITSKVEFIDNIKKEDITSYQITALSRDLFIVRLLMLYYTIIIVGVLMALFFWKKILTAFQKSNLFSPENRKTVHYLGWLLILYFPLFSLINHVFETLISLQIGMSSVSPSLCQDWTVGLILVILGSVILFIGKIMNQGIS